MTRLQRSLPLRPARLPSACSGFDTPLWPVGSLLPPGVCYRALQRLPGQDFHLQEEYVFVRTHHAAQYTAFMFFRKKDDRQRLNLEALKPRPAELPVGTPATQAIPPSTIDPVILEAVSYKAKEILDSGRMPEWLFVGRSATGLLTLQATRDQGPVMLLFSSPFAASDYLRAIGILGKTVQFKVETLPERVQSWLSAGVQTAALDRCPRCPELLSIDLASMAKWTQVDFAKNWAHLRATRLVGGEIRIRSAINHYTAGSHAAARNDLEYIRDHFDCGIPYLHQMIALLAEMQGDGPGKAASLDRLKEFGPDFEGPLDFSQERLVAALAGLMVNFGIHGPVS
jgi:hypothetical protein